MYLRLVLYFKSEICTCPAVSSILRIDESLDENLSPFGNTACLLHPVQVPQWDAPLCLALSINLLKLPSRSQIMPPRPINEYVFYPSHKETLFPVMFGKIGGPHWNKIFSPWSYVFRLTLQLGSRESVLKILRWVCDI